MWLYNKLLFPGAGWKQGQRVHIGPGLTPPSLPAPTLQASEVGKQLAREAGRQRWVVGGERDSTGFFLLLQPALLVAGCTLRCIWQRRPSSSSRQQVGGAAEGSYAIFPSCPDREENAGTFPFSPCFFAFVRRCGRENQRVLCGHLGRKGLSLLARNWGGRWGGQRILCFLS